MDRCDVEQEKEENCEEKGFFFLFETVANKIALQSIGPHRPLLWR